MKVKKMINLEIESLSYQIQNKNLNDDEIFNVCLSLVDFMTLKEVLG